MHRKLPTNLTWVTHHISIVASCYRRGEANETILPTLEDSPKAM